MVRREVLFLSSVIVFRSLTEAQRALSALKRSGIPATLGKPATQMGRGSCAHGLRLASRGLARALHVLDAGGGRYTAVYDLLPAGRSREGRP